MATTMNFTQDIIYVSILFYGHYCENINDFEFFRYQVKHTPDIFGLGIMDAKGNWNGCMGQLQRGVIYEQFF